MFKVFAGLLSGLDLRILFTSLLSPQKDVLVPTKEREYAYWCWVQSVNQTLIISIILMTLIFI